MRLSSSQKMAQLFTNFREINMSWLSMEDIKPEHGQEVWYYFHICGVHKGFYERNEYGDTFYGNAGVLTNDVTHWMPVVWSKEKPDKPKE